MPIAADSVEERRYPHRIIRRSGFAFADNKKVYCFSGNAKKQDLGIIDLSAKHKIDYWLFHSYIL